MEGEEIEDAEGVSTKVPAEVAAREPGGFPRAGEIGSEGFEGAVDALHGVDEVV